MLHQIADEVGVSFRTVEVVKRAEHDRWDIVEAIQQDMDEAGLTACAVRGDEPRIGEGQVEHLAHAGGSSVNTGLYQVCDEIAEIVGGAVTQKTVNDWASVRW